MMSSPLERQILNQTSVTQMSAGNITRVSEETTAMIESDLGLRLFKGLAMSLVIVATLLGNILVISAVLKFKSLRSMNNYFIVSLAVADLLVGLMVQPFNMYNEMVQGDWKFGHTMCNFYNSNDVFFSTASLLHLCCISCDRYIAILHPFVYERAMTRLRVLVMISGSWILSALVSYVPIFGGWYTTSDHLEKLRNTPTLCTFEVTQTYAFVSSSISFWIPCSVMVILYQRILKTALTQEKQIRALMKPVANLQYGDSEYELDELVQKDNSNNNISDVISSIESDAIDEQNNQEMQNLTPKRQIVIKKDYKQMKKLRKEHRAVKTLGIIMGSFIVCMGPIFLWYTVTFGICPETCKLSTDNTWVITVVFWIGYFNSCMNPFIYAFFNRDFQVAFKRLFGMCKKRDALTRQVSTSS